MAKVTFVLPDRPAMTADYAGERESLMELGRRHGVPGVIGSCGGFMACATCHVHVDAAWLTAAGPAGAEEREIIEMTADPRPESRLGCQLWITPAMDGLIVRVAPA